MRRQGRYGRAARRRRCCCGRRSSCGPRGRLAPALTTGKGRERLTVADVLLAAGKRMVRLVTACVHSSPTARV